jgi:hypothetical protein
LAKSRIHWSISKASFGCCAAAAASACCSNHKHTAQTHPSKIQPNKYKLSAINLMKGEAYVRPGLNPGWERQCK